MNTINVPKRLNDSELNNLTPLERMFYEMSIENFDRLIEKEYERKRNNGLLLDDYETSAEYYNETFVNGNKSHVVNDLNKIKQISSIVWGKILMGLSEEVKAYYITRIQG